MLNISTKLIICLLLVGCRTTTNNSAKDINTPSQFQTITLNDWQTLASSGSTGREIGCSCEATPNGWALFRFADLMDRSYKILIGESEDLQSCVSSKFQQSNCQYRF